MLAHKADFQIIWIVHLLDASRSGRMQVWVVDRC